MTVTNFQIFGTDIRLTNKPHGEELGKIRKSFKLMGMTDLESFKSYIEDGHPYIMATFKDGGTTKFEDLEKCTGIALDFEGGNKGEWTEAKFMTFCNKYNILPNIFYHSFSSTTRAPRFRALYIMNRISPNAFKELATLVILAFNIKMGCNKNDRSYGIDSQSTVPTQQYNPGKGEVKILNTEYVEVENFIKAIVDMNAKGLKIIEKETNILSITDSKEQYESKIGTFSHPYIDENGKTKFKTYQILGKKTKNDNKVDENLYNNTKSELLLKKCRLSRELFESKQDYYSYHLSTGLVYSLVKLRNGKDIYKQICDNNATSAWKTKERIFDDIKKKDYMPQSCRNFGCPYCDSCPYSNGNPANLARPAYISKQAAAPTLEVNEARAKMYDAIDEALSRPSSIISIIEAPVGTGKTFATIDTINSAIVYTQNNQSIDRRIEALRNKKRIAEYQRQQMINDLCSKKTKRNDKFIIASPRHNLCEQIKNDLLKKSNITFQDIVYITPRPSIPIREYEIKVSELENLGILSLSNFSEYVKLFKSIRDVMVDNIDKELEISKLDVIYDNINSLEYLQSLKYSQEDYDLISHFVRDGFEYIHTREDARKANILICTHSFLSHCDLSKFEQNIVFIDEDCSESFIQSGKLKISTLKKMIEALDKSTYDYYGFEFGFEDIAEALEFITTHSDGKIYTYNVSDFLKSPCSKPNKQGKCKYKKGLTNKKLEALIDLKKEYKMDFTKILELRSFSVENDWLNYTTFKGLDTANKKIILTSATPAPEFFYKNIFNKEIKLTKIDFVKLRGKLIQYYDMSSFRKNLKDDEYIKKIDKIKEIEDIDCVISYKAFNEKLEAVLNFGNLEGINAYSGQNILVAGTYLVNSTICQLIAHMFDSPESSNFSVYEPENVKQYKINFDGIEQLFTTYSNEKARDYQLWQCWKTTEQAIGRARLINNDCKVVLLSKLIHPLATLTTFEEEMEADKNDWNRT